MLVSQMAHFNALNSMNNAAFASMQTSNNMMGMISKAHTFAGDNNFDMLHEIDKHLGIEMATNNLLYKLASLQEKMFSKLHKSELDSNKKSLDVLA